MAQTWTGSIVEMKANIISGFALNYGINVLILPVLYDPKRPFLSAFEIGCVFTVVSVCRQLFIRRKMDKIKRFQTPESKPASSLDLLIEDLDKLACGIPVENQGREHA